MSQTIGQKVKALRKSRNVSQKILCAKLNMPISTFSNKEHNNRFTTEELQIICNTLSCPYELIISDAPFNPMQINFGERNDIIAIKQAEPDFLNYAEADPIFLTDKEKKLLKKLRTFTSEQRSAVWEFIEKFEDGEN